VNKTNISFRADRIVNEGVDIDQLKQMTGEDVIQHEIREAERAGHSRLGTQEAFIFKPAISSKKSVEPRRFLRAEEAEEEMSEAEVDELRLRDVQEDEEKILEKSQQDEIEELRRKTEEEIGQAGSPSEKQQQEQKAKTRLQELKQRHEEERTEIKARHKKEAEKASRRKIKKNG
jgi:hypothetical protein